MGALGTLEENKNETNQKNKKVFVKNKQLAIPTGAQLR